MSIHQLFFLQPDSDISLQKQIREQVVKAINNRQIAFDEPLPSSRKLSAQLNVARNTVTLAYDHLLADGYLIAVERRGYFVNPDLQLNQSQPADLGDEEFGDSPPSWLPRIQINPSKLPNISKPLNWRDYRYPFIYGQLNYRLFPTNNWRECSRDAFSVGSIKDWTVDHIDHDDPLLVDQIHKHLLPRRGVWVEPEQILVTVGSQHALYLLATLFLGKDTVMGLENPGYVDVRNIASLTPAKLKPLAVDDQGLVVDESLDECDYIFVTPSHQSPTTVTMPLERRYELLQKAAEQDIVLIEDDYENEISYESNPLPALKSLDKNDRVIYLSSLSKTLSPGLRIGYMVGPVWLIRELRALRRLMLRHPASNNQRSVALFLARGYHDTLVRNLVRAFAARCQTMQLAIEKHLAPFCKTVAFGGSSFWLEANDGIDTGLLRALAEQEGILLESGDIHFLDDNPPTNFFRLGFSSIAEDRINDGINKLASVMQKLA